LEIHVSDPQAVYTDGSRQMTAPLPVASSVTATSGMLRASIPWAYDHEVHDFFRISEPDQAVVLSSSGEIDLKIGKLFVRESGIYQTDEGTTINMEEHMLSGGWQIDEVLPYPEAIISRGFADGKYMIAGAPSTQSLTFAQSLTAANGALQIYATDSEEHLGYFKTLSSQDGLQFSTLQGAVLMFGTPADGLLVGPSTILQTGYGSRLDFETSSLTGTKWYVTENPTEALGIVNKGYADGHYLRSDIPLTNSISTSVTNKPILKMSNGPGFLKPYGNKIEFSDDQTKHLFFVEGASGNASGLRVQNSGIYREEGATLTRAVELDTGNLYGKWYLSEVDEGEDYTLIHRLYADGRYLRRNVGITTNRVIQAGNTLVISNGLITAILP
jgi:hypothetical protein